MDKTRALELSASPDQYKVIGINTGHLKESDMEIISSWSFESDCTMVFERETGAFIKLYEELEDNLYYEGINDRIRMIIETAHNAGYSMIEFDSAATLYSFFPTYEW